MNNQFLFRSLHIFWSVVCALRHGQTFFQISTWLSRAHCKESKTAIKDTHEYDEKGQRNRTGGRERASERAWIDVVNNDDGDDDDEDDKIDNR